MKRLYSIILLVIGVTTIGYGQITTTVNPTIADLTNYFQGVGLTITNMTVTGSPNSYGFFSGTSNMAFGNGIILSTGVINNGINNPASTLLSADNSLGGNIYSNALGGSSSTFDACMIEFDCVPSNSTLLFDFSFGSEEYNEYIGSGFNDVFGILISGPNPIGGNYNNTNFAIIPGTTTPIVSVNNVNNGTTGTGPCVNCAYYIDNTNGTSIAYDGFTSGLQGSVPVSIGQTYHIRIVIADADDGIYDSCVMLLANSFKTTSSTSISESELDSNILIYPVPSTDKICFSSSSFNVKKVELYSIDGKKIDNIKLNESNTSINIKGLSSGIYFIHLSNDNNTIIKKVIID